MSYFFLLTPIRGTVRLHSPFIFWRSLLVSQSQEVFWCRLSFFNEIHPSQSAEFLVLPVALLFLLVTVLSRFVLYPVHSLWVVMDSSMSLYTTAFSSALTITIGNNSALSPLLPINGQGREQARKRVMGFWPLPIPLTWPACKWRTKYISAGAREEAVNILVYCFFMRLYGDPKAESVLYFQTHCENAGCIHLHATGKFYLKSFHTSHSFSYQVFLILLFFITHQFKKWRVYQCKLSG